MVKKNAVFTDLITVPDAPTLNSPVIVIVRAGGDWTTNVVIRQYEGTVIGYGRQGDKAHYLLIEPTAWYRGQRWESVYDVYEVEA